MQAVRGKNMNQTYTEESFKAYFDSFNKQGGEKYVRACIESGIWENDRLRLGAGKVFLWQIEEATRAAQLSKPWHEKWWGKLIIGAILVLFGWLLGLCKDYYLPKDQSASQPQVFQRNIETQK